MIRSVSTCVVFLTLAISGLFKVGEAVKINEIKVPKVANTSSPVLLDCNYTLDPDDNALVVKWYHNNENLVYQWISGHPPTAIGILKGRLNLNYIADTTDPNKYYRALFILKPTSELTGNYTCAVSTFTSEDNRSKSMLVLTAPQDLELRAKRLGSRKFEISCEANGVFPKPHLSLKFEDRELTDLKIEATQNQYIFDTKVTTNFYAQDFVTEIECIMTIPEANYVLDKKSVINIKDETPDAAVDGSNMRYYSYYVFSLTFLLSFFA